MAHVAGAVHVVTTDGPAGRRGVTVSAACSVSDDPATLLVCLQRHHEQNDIFVKNGVFALNTLAAAHEPLAEAFSGRQMLSQEDRFAMAEWETLQTGSPVLADALDVFDCRIIGSQDIATHRVLFGRVASLRTGPNRSALIYLNRAYHHLEM